MPEPWDVSNVTLDEIIKLHNKADGLNDNVLRLDDLLKQMLHLVQGNEDPSKGLIIRVDRLEQTEEKRLWLVRAALGAAIGAIVVAVLGWVYHPAPIVYAPQNPTYQTAPIPAPAAHP